MVAILHSSVNNINDEQKIIHNMINSLSASDKHHVVLSVFVSIFNLLRSSASKFQVLKGK